MAKKTSLPLPVYLPPKSVVRLIKADRSTPAWRGEIGKLFRVGYYSEHDGLQTVWLVDHEGNYTETVPQHEMPRYFLVEKLSRETDFFGKRRRRLGPMPLADLRRVNRNEQFRSASDEKDEPIEGKSPPAGRKASAKKSKTQKFGAMSRDWLK